MKGTLNKRTMPIGRTQIKTYRPQSVHNIHHSFLHSLNMLNDAILTVRYEVKSLEGVNDTHKDALYTEYIDDIYRTFVSAQNVKNTNIEMHCMESVEGNVSTLECIATSDVHKRK